MSLKSESDILDRSYSVKSVSEGSFSGSDEEEESLARELMNKMTPAVLSKLRKCFKHNKARNQAREIDRRVEEVMRAAAAEEGIEFATSTSQPEDNLCLDENGFVTSIDKIFGHHKYTIHAQKLYSLLDPFCSGKVWWRHVVARLVAVGAKKTRSRAEIWAPVADIGVRRLEHCKRETLIKLVSIERQETFCYAAVSRDGKVGVYNGELKLLHSYEVFYHRTGLRRRVRNCWITDAVYLSDVQFLMISASDRSVTIYEATTLIHTPLFCITGIPNIPTCLAYHPSSDMGDSSELIFGTERGDLIRVKFLQPRIQLFHCKTPDNINYYFWMELSAPPHTANCSIITWRRVHSRSVRRVSYSRDGTIVLSCSHDSVVSVRARHVPGKMDDYVFKVQRGVSSFHVVSPLHLLATGSYDGVVRLWETTQSTPFACLTAPTAPAVLDVAVVPAQEIVLAFCNNCNVHIWDMYEECLLQTIKIKFPFLGVLGKKVDFGAYCIHPGPVRKCPEEDVVDVPIEASSRRGSSVYQGSTGGLMLQLNSEGDGKLELEQEPEYSRFDRPELLIACCDHVCTIQLKQIRGQVLPPPGDTLRPRRPSVWDMPELNTIMSPRGSRLSVASNVPTPRLLLPSTADTLPSYDHTRHDLETLLNNAGLKGILEKDFVLMQGLKHDLNKKLAEMEANEQIMQSAVSAGAPYLALQTFEPVPISRVDEMTDEYRRIMKLFPEPSVAGTPSGSEMSCPSHKRSSRLPKE